MSMVVAVEPRRLALRFCPPAVIVEYSRVSAGMTGKHLFHHEIDLSGSIATENVRAIVDDMVRQHAAVLGSDKVSTQQLERLVARLAEKSGATPPSASASMSASASAPPLPQADYNRVSASQLVQVKQRMDVVFERNIVRPGERGYEYDKRVAFQAAQEASDWDDE